MSLNWTLEDVDQTGRTALLTGAHDGLGFHVTGAAASRRARVVVACGNREKAERARLAIPERSPGAAPEIVDLDLDDLQSVRACGPAAGERYSLLDIIACNAGLMAVPFGVTRDGLEMQMGVNYSGHFALAGRRAYDPALRRKLWEKSQELTAFAIHH